MDFFHLALQVNKLRDKLVNDGDVKPQMKLKRVVKIVWKAESIVDQQEFVRAITVAIEELISSLHCSSSLINHSEISGVDMLVSLKPGELFLRVIVELDRLGLALIELYRSEGRHLR